MTTRLIFAAAAFLSVAFAAPHPDPIELTEPLTLDVTAIPIPTPCVHPPKPIHTVLPTKKPVVTDKPYLRTGDVVLPTDVPVEADEVVYPTDMPVETDEPVYPTDMPIETEEPVYPTDMPVETDEAILPPDAPMKTYKVEPSAAPDTPVKTHQPPVTFQDEIKPTIASSTPKPTESKPCTRCKHTKTDKQTKCHLRNIDMSAGTAEQCCIERHACGSVECSGTKACENPDMCYCRKTKCKKVYIHISYAKELDGDCASQIIEL